MSRIHGDKLLLDRRTDDHGERRRTASNSRNQSYPIDESVRIAYQILTALDDR